MIGRRTTAPRNPVPDEYAEMRRRGRRRLWRLLGALALLAVVGGLVAAAYFSPLMSVRDVTVTGDSAVPRDEILTVAEVPSGLPLLQVETAAVANRIARIPGVESVKVERGYPSTVSIEVVERTPRAVVSTAQGKLGVMDRLGVVYLEFDSRAAMGKAGRDGVAYRTLPRVEVPTPGPADPTTAAALVVAGDLPDWLRGEVVSITASSPADLRLKLTRERTVVWGDAERGGDKAEALAYVLRLPGSTFNVSAPEYPAVS
ncbi:MAG: FtsQ-type POTRA domain-containing protein [Gordonia sp. (in: high G+C Gram-positive bacteria)]|uniref:cell division protein FtsQ/DivIB n=1 Tax=Gordonia sp. (in: high G+C Gram-positive bacteria) TaxID=84139 RepID=UPI0039E2D76C